LSTSLESYSAPRPITRQSSHDKVVQIIKGFAPGDILDAQCGQGALAERLREEGFNVRCCDIDLDLMKAQGFENKQADLNTERIDYPDASFDYVTSTNGLHRLYNIDNAIGEFARVLRHGGRLVISIPNYASIVRRMRFLLTGTIAKNITQQTYLQVTNAATAHFRDVLTPVRVVNALRSHGFLIENIDKTRTQKRGLWLMPIAIIAKIIGGLLYHKERDRYGLAVANSLSILLGGHHVVFVAKKNGE
jgi:2-polyprenyl-3-methyl-5-hydroxy-6-metoxy-1,4-benzoquinol methylase